MSDFGFRMLDFGFRIADCVALLPLSMSDVRCQRLDVDITCAVGNIYKIVHHTSYIAHFNSPFPSGLLYILPATP
jgi:hypothetical protein